MKVKKYIDVMGIAFKVLFVKQVDEEHNAGETDGAKRIIKISTTENPTEELKYSVLVHEYLHAVLYVTGQSERMGEKEEESLVLALEHALADKLKLELYEEVDE